MNTGIYKPGYARPIVYKGFIWTIDDKSMAPIVSYGGKSVLLTSEFIEISKSKGEQYFDNWIKSLFIKEMRKDKLNKIFK